MKRIAYGLYSATGAHRLTWRLTPQRLRILVYHGICADALVNEPWMPPYFTAASAFDQQLQYLRRHASVLPLADAVDRLRAGTLPDRPVCITFDDGYANNLDRAYPLLRQYGLHATIFLATAYSKSQQLLPFDRVRLVDLATGGRAFRGDRGLRPLLDYHHHPLDLVLDRLDEWWDALKVRLTDEQWDCLRPLRADEIGQADEGVIDFGAHTHNHCILRHETAQRREDEISRSIGLTRQLTGRPVRLFSYPNGQPGDFGEADKAILRVAGIEAAVTTRCHMNDATSDPLALGRYSVSLFHTSPGFVAEVTGFRSKLMSALGRA